LAAADNGALAHCCHGSVGCAKDHRRCDICIARGSRTIDLRVDARAARFGRSANEMTILHLQMTPVTFIADFDNKPSGLTGKDIYEDRADHRK
jgi:hypothetical protein